MLSDVSYDTAINVLGGLRSVDALVEGQPFQETAADYSINSDLRTFESRGRVDRMINTTLRAYRDDSHRELIEAFFASNAPFPDREKVFFWHLALNNRLFREYLAVDW